MTAPVRLTSEQALSFSTRPEDEFFDRKSADCSGKSAQKAGVAMANAEGGEVIFGVADEKSEPDPKKRLSPYSKPEDANGVLQALFELNPALVFRYSFYEVESG
jgi:ATP-dependent DNA helicase RecG